VTILVKVDPADVVAVPVDYHNAKMRVCKHETIRELDPNTKGFAFTSAVLDETVMDETPMLADDSTVLTHTEAMAHFDCNASALRKRLNRGITAKRVYVDGVEMVQVIEADAPVADAPVDDTVSFEDAMRYYIPTMGAHGNGSPEQDFMSEIDTPVPDLVLRAHYRKVLLDKIKT